MTRPDPLIWLKSNTVLTVSMAEDNAYWIERTVIRIFDSSSDWINKIWRDKMKGVKMKNYQFDRSPISIWYDTVGLGKFSQCSRLSNSLSSAWGSRHNPTDRCSNRTGRTRAATRHGSEYTRSCSLVQMSFRTPKVVELLQSPFF